MSAGVLDCGNCVNPVMGCAGRCARSPITGTEDEQVDDLFADAQMAGAEQVRLAEEAVAAVNRLVDGQFGLGYEVLRHAVHAQTECYRALHHARQVKP